MPTLQSNGIELAYELHGAGQPLLFIGGVGYGGWFWRKVAPALAACFQTITFDNRGAGGSDKPDGPYTVPMLAADAAGLLDALHLKGAVVFGHSLGGFIAQELALMRPDLASKLILAGANHGGQKVIPITPEAMQVLTNRQGDPMELIKRGIAIATAPGFAERHPEAVDELIQYRLTNPVPPAQYSAQVMAGAGMIAYSDETVADRMRRLTMPTLILFGEHDKVVPPGNAELMAARLPDARIAIIPNTGHIFPMEDPAATVNAVMEFAGSFLLCLATHR
ncbi:MAG: alpha/beta fold hydrolase [Chloroflexi bacterium]|nr:alpha/beta fold hydrolase [Chloroflexota bacterium]